MEDTNMNNDTKEQIDQTNKDVFKSVWFDVPELLPTFTGRAKELGVIKEIIQKEHIVVLSGLNGIGKTELAVQYAYNFGKFYESNVIWVNCTTRLTLKNSFSKLTEQLQMELVDLDGEDKCLERIIKDVFLYFGRMKALFIFDNVQNGRVEKIMPRNPTVDILIICNNSKWISGSGIEEVMLKNFEENEALDFVKGVFNEEAEENMEKLIKLHQCPLSLELSLAYIREERKEDPEFGMSRYVDDLVVLYNRTKLEMDDYARILYTTLKLSLDKLLNESVMEIVKVLAYCSGVTLEQSTGIDLLKKFAIIKEKTLKIHPLVQQMLRISLKETEEENLKRIQELLTTDIDFGHHVEFWNHAYNYDKFVNTFADGCSERVVTVLNALVIASRFETVRCIIERIDPGKFQELVKTVDRYGRGLLHSAVSRSDPRLVDLLLAKNCDVNTGTTHTWTPLHLAVDQERLDIVKILLSNQALVNTKTSSKFTPLHLAARNGSEEIVRLLLSKGAGINIPTSKKYTALHLAVQNGHLGAVRVLLADDRVDINAGAEDNVTALHIAAENGCLEIVESLLDSSGLSQWKSKVDLNCKTTTGNTALQLAISNNRIAVVEVLVSKGVGGDADVKNAEEKVVTVEDVVESDEEWYNKRQGTSGISGQLYEIELSMLFLLYGVTKSGDKTFEGFYQATNMVEAGDFDDVVFKFYKGEDLDKLNVIFLQAKHKETVEKEKDKKINIDTLLSKSEKGDFILRKYLSAYNKIQQQFVKNLDHPVFKDELENYEMVIYTNAIFDLNRARGNAVKEHEHQDHVLYIQDLPKDNVYYKLIDTKEVLEFLKPSLDYEVLVKELAQAVLSKTIDMNKPVFVDYHMTVADVAIEQTKNKREGVLKESFFDDIDEFKQEVLEEIQKKKQELKGKPVEELKEILRKIKISLPEKFDNAESKNLRLDLPKKYFTDDEVRSFLKKLKLYVGQPNEAQLSELIKAKIKSVYQVEANDIDSVFSEVEYKIRKWWKEGRVFLKETNSFFQQAARVSVRFDVREPVTLFTGRTEKLKELHECLHNAGQVVISQMASVTGLGGVGKSELARRYISDHCKEYHDNIIWINADNYFTLSDSFRRLAEKLGIKVLVDGKEKDLKSVVAEVYGYFGKRHRKSLFVFDNAASHKTHKTTDEAIDKFLPAGPGKPFVIITSRNQEWGDIRQLALDVFTEEEAVEFIKKALGVVGGGQDEDIKALAFALQYFPLALRQAVAYIKKENEVTKLWKKEAFTIKKYIEQFNREAAEFLEGPAHEDDRYTKTVFTTWRITIKKIGQKICGQQALHMLNIMAYFAPDRISIEGIFLDSEEREEELHNAVELLNQYSMAVLDQGELFIHRLVQQVTRIELEKLDKEKDVLKEALQLMNKPMCTESFTGSIHTFHAVSTWNYASSYEELVKEFSILPSAIVLKLSEGVRYEEGSAFGRQATKRLEEVLSPEDVSTLNVKQNTANILLNQGMYDEALKDLQEVYDKEKREEILGEKHPVTLNTKNNIAVVLHNKGKYTEALEQYREILVLQEEILGADHYNTLNTKSNIAASLNANGNYPEAIKMCEEVLEVQNRVLGSDHPAILTTKNNISSLYRKLGKLDETVRLLQEVLDKRIQVLGADNPNTLSTKHSLADVLSDMKRYDEALKLYQELLEKKKDVLGVDHPSTLNTENSIVQALYGKGDYSKAMEKAQEVLDKRTTYLGSNHPNTISTRNIMAMILDQQGKYVESLQIYREVYNKLGNVLRFDHSDVVSLKFNLARILEKLGWYDEALRTLREVSEEFSSIFGPGHPDSARAQREIAKTLGQQGKYEEALPVYLDALDKFIQNFGEDHVDTLVLRSDMAWVLLKLEMGDEALQIYQDVLKKLTTKLPPGDSQIMGVKNNIAGELQKQRKYPQALSMYLEILPVLETSPGPDHPDTLTVKNNIALLYKVQGEHSRALDMYQEVFEKRGTVLGARHPMTLGVKINIAGVLAAQNRYEEALLVLLETVHKFEDSNHPYAVQMAQKIQALQHYLQSVNAWQ